MRLIGTYQFLGAFDLQKEWSSKRIWYAANIVEVYTSKQRLDTCIGKTLLGFPTLHVFDGSRHGQLKERRGRHCGE